MNVESMRLRRQRSLRRGQRPLLRSLSFNQRLCQRRRGRCPLHHARLFPTVERRARLGRIGGVADRHHRLAQVLARPSHLRAVRRHQAQPRHVIDERLLIPLRQLAEQVAQPAQIRGQLLPGSLDRRLAAHRAGRRRQRSIPITARQWVLLAASAVHRAPPSCPSSQRVDAPFSTPVPLSANLFHGLARNYHSRRVCFRRDSPSPSAWQPRFWAAANVAPATANTPRPSRSSPARRARRCPPNSPPR